MTLAHWNWLCTATHHLLQTQHDGLFRKLFIPWEEFTLFSTTYTFLIRSVLRPLMGSRLKIAICMWSKQVLSTLYYCFHEYLMLPIAPQSHTLWQHFQSSCQYMGEHCWEIAMRRCVNSGLPRQLTIIVCPSLLPSFLSVNSYLGNCLHDEKKLAGSIIAHLHNFLAYILFLEKDTKRVYCSSYIVCAIESLCPPATNAVCHIRFISSLLAYPGCGLWCGVDTQSFLPNGQLDDTAYIMQDSGGWSILWRYIPHQVWWRLQR